MAVMVDYFSQAKEHDLLMPVHKPEQGEDYTGATVIEPEKGWVSMSVNGHDCQTVFVSSGIMMFL